MIKILYLHIEMKGGGFDAIRHVILELCSMCFDTGTGFFANSMAYDENQKALRQMVGCCMERSLDRIIINSGTILSSGATGRTGSLLYKALKDRRTSWGIGQRAFAISAYISYIEYIILNAWSCGPFDPFVGHVVQ